MEIMKTALIVIAIAMLTGLSYGQEMPDSDPWYFSAEGIRTAYRYQQSFGERLRSPVRGRDCLLGKQRFVGSFRGKNFSAPCRFVTETIRHIKEMLVAGAARYLFPLDADHAHLAIPLELWEKKYRWLPKDTLLSALLEEPTLAALYHTAEHLIVVDGNTKEGNEEIKKWKERRNVLGFYDGRPIQILPPDPRGFGVGAPASYYTVGGFAFLASPGGELSLFMDGKAIVFDISLDIGDGEPLPDAVLKTAAN